MTSKTDEFIKEYDKYLVTSFGKPFPGIVVVSGEDNYLTDLEGKKYLDFWTGVTVTTVGHRNPKVQEAVRKQMDKLVHCASLSYYSMPALELAKKLASISPIKPCKATFHSSGTEANDLALKMVKRFTKKHEIIGFQGSYHSWGYHAAVPGTATAGYPHFAPALGPSVSGIYYAPPPYCYRCPLGLEYPECSLRCAKMVESIITHSTSRDVAGFLAEPIQGVGGKIVPPKDYFQELKKVLDKYNVCLIFDEVQTRLGILGHMWAADAFKVKPDVISTAKSIANGWPLSAVIARTDIADSLEHGDHYTTYGNQPVSCAAAVATIDYIIENKLWENASKMGNLMLKGLKELVEECEIVGDARGMGCMMGIEIVKDKKSKEPNEQGTNSIRKYCADNGLIVGKGGWWNNVVRLQPSMTIKEEHVNKALEIVGKAAKSS